MVSAEWKTWSNKEINYLKDKFPNTNNQEISINLGVSVNQLKYRASVLGLRKSQDFISELRSNASTKIIERKTNMHSDMIRFANTLEEGVTYRTLMPVFNKYGFNKFKTMYKLYTAQ